MDSIIKKISDVLGISSQGVTAGGERKKGRLVREVERRDRVTISDEARRRYDTGEGVDRK